MLISRNEALERLTDYRAVNMIDPESAKDLAISVLLDIIDDSHITFSFKMACGFRDQLEHMPKLAADSVQEAKAFMEREHRINLNAPQPYKET